VSDSASPDVRTDPARPGYALQRVWVIAGHPAPIVPETLQLPNVLIPPKQGTVLNVITFPPDEAWKGKATVEQAKAFYASIGASSIATCGSLPNHPYSQKSNTVDFLVVTEGEITLVLEQGEATLKAGEMGVVRGGNHAFSNRSGKPAVVAISSHDAVAGQG
jgi:quercetin dioxygenase-like cupin family protein